MSELVAYLAGLDALAPYVARTDVLIPGHGHPTDRPMQRLDADRRHVDALLGSSSRHCVGRCRSSRVRSAALSRSPDVFA